MTGRLRAEPMGPIMAWKPNTPNLKAGSPDPFINPAGYKSYVAVREATFHEELTKQQMDQR